MTTLQYGERGGRHVSERIAKAIATIALLKSVGPEFRTDGQIVHVIADGSRWQFLAAGALTGDDQLVVSPTAGTGTWLKMLGAIDLALPITFATADAAILLTVPAGAYLHVRRCYWEVTTGWTGGASSAIGASSSNATYTTKGDLLGGASGDLAATLVSGRLIPGTIGAKTAAGIFLIPTNTIRFDRIVSVYTAGAGNLHIVADLLANAGA